MKDQSPSYNYFQKQITIFYHGKAESGKIINLLIVAINQEKKNRQKFLHLDKPFLVCS